MINVQSVETHHNFYQYAMEYVPGILADVVTQWNVPLETKTNEYGVLCVYCKTCGVFLRPKGRGIDLGFGEQIEA